jgi:hypothetical protein
MREARLPGLFVPLVAKGAVAASAVAPLIERLPAEERFVQTAVRDGEGFDSTRWPVARDAALAQMAARRLPDPDGRIAETLWAIEVAAGDRIALRALTRRSVARMLAAAGGDEALLAKMWRDVTEEDRAVFTEPRWPLQTANDVMALASAFYEAADGLYAYHAYRGLPGPSAEPAAMVVERALALGTLRVDELLAAALTLV